MGTGDIPRVGSYRESNALWVIDSDSPSLPRPATREPHVAWPPPGYIPYVVTFPRWSFSYPGADFSAASVTMTESGAAITTRLEPVVGGFGENTLVWIPKGLSNTANWPRPTSDTTYDVTIANVRMGGSPQTFNYRVTVFDPNMLLADFDANGAVNAADLGRWRANAGASGATVGQGDADRDGDVDGADFLVWQRENGLSLTGTGLVVPEPMGAALAAVWLALVCAVRRRR
jgi:hypothetical protein